MKTIIFSILTLVILIAFVFFYYQLEVFYYSDFGCGCSSLCKGYYPGFTAKIIGWTLIAISILLITSILWKFVNLSKWFMLPSLLIFIVAIYGNGYLLFNKGGCGLSLNKRMLFLYEKQLGEFAKTDGESLHLEQFEKGAYAGKMLGFHLEKNVLTVYRVGESPLKISTNFLFWQLDRQALLEDLSYGLNTFRIPPANSSDFKKIEFIGGHEMTEEAFRRELVLLKEIDSSKIKRITRKKLEVGATGFLVELE